MNAIGLRLAGLAALALVAAPARAQSVLEFRVNPERGTTLGITGSYRLAGSPRMTGDAVAIRITADGVTLDLNGHSITAAPGSTKAGIVSTAAGTTIMNGTVIGFGLGGINATGGNSRVRDVRVEGCNKIGNIAALEVGTGGVVERCIVTNNTPAASGTATGIRAGSGSRITGNIVENNDSPDSVAVGITGGDSSAITHNTVRGHSGLGQGSFVFGIGGGAYSTIQNNTVADNQAAGTGNVTGIATSAGAIIQSNNVSGQRSGSSGAGIVVGISAGPGSTVLDNQCRSNSAGFGTNSSCFGIDVDMGSLVRGNTVSEGRAQGTGMSAGILANGESRITDNLCSGNTGGARSWGIRAWGPGHMVSGNTCINNGTAGLVFYPALNNRAESNRLRQTTGIDLTNGVNPASLGTGPLENVAY